LPVTATALVAWNAVHYLLERSSGVLPTAISYVIGGIFLAFGHTVRMLWGRSVAAAQRKARNADPRRIRCRSPAPAGRTTVARPHCRTALARGARALIADPDGGYLKRFYDKDRRARNRAHPDLKITPP